MDLSLLRIVESTTVDGVGMRTSVYAAGCGHHCPGCHNPQSWDIKKGTQTDIGALAERLLDNPFEDITFTGGDPLYQAEAFAKLACIIKRRSTKNIWCYTGYTFEAIKDKAQYADLLQYIDVLVDGRYVAEKRNTDLMFRGSENQRLVDVPRSLAAGRVVEYTPKTVSSIL